VDIGGRNLDHKESVLTKDERSLSHDAAERIIEQLEAIAEKNPAGTWTVVIRSQAGLVFVREAIPDGKPGIRNRAQYSGKKRLG
jgi:hypothetical protein